MRAQMTTVSNKSHRPWGHIPQQLWGQAACNISANTENTISANHHISIQDVDNKKT